MALFLLKGARTRNPVHLSWTEWNETIRIWPISLFYPPRRLVEPKSTDWHSSLVRTNCCPNLLFEDAYSTFMIWRLNTFPSRRKWQQYKSPKIERVRTPHSQRVTLQAGKSHCHTRSFDVACSGRQFDGAHGYLGPHQRNCRRRWYHSVGRNWSQLEGNVRRYVYTVLQYGTISHTVPDSIRFDSIDSVEAEVLRWF